MGLKHLNEWLALLANVGVIAGIVFLAIEINQNNLLMLSQTRSDISQSISDVLLQAAFSDYPHIAANDLVLDELDATDQQRAFFYQSARLKLWENFYYQYRNGLFEEEEFLSEREVWKRALELEVVRIAYCRTRPTLSQRFVAELESLITWHCNALAD